MYKAKEQKKHSRGRPVRISRAYKRDVLLKKFTPGREYTLKFICEQLNEKYPTNKQMRNRIWEQMSMAGAVWSGKQGSRYYVFEGLKDKPREREAMNAASCAKKKIIEAFGIDEQGYTITEYLNYNDLCRIYYGKEIKDILLSDAEYQEGSVEFKALTTFNRIVRSQMNKLFWQDLRNWKDNIGHPELNMLIPERRNMVTKRYKYNDKTYGIVVSDKDMTEYIEKNRFIGSNAGNLLYGKNKNPYEQLKLEGIEVFCPVWKIQFVKDVASKYYFDDKKVQAVLERRLQKHVYKYLKSENYSREIKIEKEYNRDVFDELVWISYFSWCKKVLKYSLPDEEMVQFDKDKRLIGSVIDLDAIIGEDGDIGEDEDFIVYEYLYEDN